MGDVVPFPRDRSRQDATPQAGAPVRPSDLAARRRRRLSGPKPTEFVMQPGWFGVRLRPPPDFSYALPEHVAPPDETA